MDSPGQEISSETVRLVTTHQQRESRSTNSGSACIAIRVRGLVQGVGFRPAVWRIARALGLRGEVMNDTDGVLIRIVASRRQAEAFVKRLRAEALPLARIDAVEMSPFNAVPKYVDFTISESWGGRMHTLIVPDAATCADCLAETFDPRTRRHRFAFTTCTNCGPRLTIITRAPYDRPNTSMAPFAMCENCHREYEDPADRRFHAEPISCPTCGPKLRLVDALGRASPGDDPDRVAQAAWLIAEGRIVAIKGLGGFHLACNATDAAAVQRLRDRKRRLGKAFALMARDLAVVQRYAKVTAAEAALLESPAAPIVLLDMLPGRLLPGAVAPGLSTLGFMLPSTPLHAVLLQDFDCPLVMTSGNLSDEPQCIDDAEACVRLAGIADYFLLHDRRIVNRVDDSVVRVMAGAPRMVRRARGYAPAPLPLPPGFERAPELLAMGGELKSTFCLVKEGQAILSQHQGDLENAETLADYEKNLGLFASLFDHTPTAVAVDCHPDYLSTQKARRLAGERSLPISKIQHHHAHVAACLAENGIPLHAPPILGIVLDGLGMGTDGQIWGGEFILSDYAGFRRIGAFKAVAMPGGAKAIREPWRSLCAHLDASIGLETFAGEFGATPLGAYLASKPTATLCAMIRNGLNTPRASSCGRLFDAVAAALGLCADAITYEGEAAVRLEALVDRRALAVARRGGAYPFQIVPSGSSGIAYLDSAPIWMPLLRDLRANASAPLIAAKFHTGLAQAVARMAAAMVRSEDHALITDTIALSGGCFQNRWLTEELTCLLKKGGLSVLLHAKVPFNDGALALGQAVVAARRYMRNENMA